MAESNISTEASTKRTVGVTTMSGVAGSVAGVQVAQFVAEMFNLTLSTDALLGLATLLAALGTLIGGYLSPSKAHQVKSITNAVTANIPTYGDIQSMVNSVADHASNGAYTVNTPPPSIATQPTIVKEEAPILVASEPTAVKDEVDPDREAVGASTAPVLENPEYS